MTTPPLSPLAKRLLLLFLPGLASCAYQDEAAYDRAEAAAARQPVFAPVGATLRLGMSERQVTQRLDSLRERDELVWRLSTHRLPMRPAARYVEGKLAELRLALQGDGLPGGAEGSELRHGLEEAYGGDGYPRQGHYETRSWFKGGTEVALSYLPGTGYELVYTDLHQLDALTVQQLRADSLHGR